MSPCCKAAVLLALRELEGFITTMQDDDAASGVSADRKEALETVLGAVTDKIDAVK